MKILIAYYSRTQSTERIAKILQKKLNCDIEAIDDVGTHKGIIGWIRGGYESAQNKNSKIAPIKKNPSKYDLVIIGSPVWASKLSSPIISYVNQYKNQFKELAIFATCNKKGFEGTFKQLKELTGKELKGELGFNNKTIENPDEEIEEFIKKVIK